MGLSFGNLVIILVLVLIVFGAGKLPKVMGDFGRSIRSLRNGLKDEGEESDDTKKLEIDKQSLLKNLKKESIIMASKKPAAKKVVAKKPAAKKVAAKKPAAKKPAAKKSAAKKK